MCNVDQDNIYNLYHILSQSELSCSGEVPHWGELVDILSCTISSLPLKYLGPPLGASLKSKAIWYVEVEEIERRLVSWKIY